MLSLVAELGVGVLFGKYILGAIHVFLCIGSFDVEAAPLFQRPGWQR